MYDKELLKYDLTQHVLYDHNNHMQEQVSLAFSRHIAIPLHIVLTSCMNSPQYGDQI